jgi:hypothetical protein
MLQPVLAGIWPDLLAGISAKFARRWLTWRFQVAMPVPMAIRPENRTSASIGRVLEDPNSIQKWTHF